MIKVERVSEPDSLQQNAKAWTKELREQIRLCGKYRKVTDTYKNRYNQEDVKEALERMYGEKCCYCEGHIGICSYEHIEHRMPKSKFPGLAFKWDNLHWSCQICNMSKDNDWNKHAPILDPVVDEVEDHLDYDLDTCEVVAKNNSLRGQTTIDHTDLNRAKVVKARKRLKQEVLRKIQQAHRTTSPSDRAFYYDDLWRMTINDPENGLVARHSMFVKKLLSELL